MSAKESINGCFSSGRAFILATVGAVVGLGNILSFPYIVGKNGGSAFLLVYLCCLLIIGMPLMMAELVIGRRSRRNPVSTFFTLAIESGQNPLWKYLGLVCLLAGVLFLSYYSVISGWSLEYGFLSSHAVFNGVTGAGVKTRFLSFIQDPAYLLMFHSVFMLATMAVVALGVSRGLHLLARFMVPALFIVLILLDIIAFNSSGFTKGVQFLLSPDFARLSWSGVFKAMEHAFFTLSLGMGAIMIYGAYMPQRVSILHSTLIVVVADTVFTLLVGLAVFPILISNDLNVTSGLDLLFINLPMAFGQMPAGAFFGTLFYVMIVLAALTTSIAIMEPGVAWLLENYRLKRIQATLISGVTIWLIGIFTVFSFNKWQFRFSLFGEIHQNGFFDVFDQLTTKILLPLAGIFIALFAGWFMSQDATRDELELREWQYMSWRFLVRYVSPFAMLIIFLVSIGIIRFE